jgi:hydroxymethylglutaryl-CoA reductase (NADPH)
MHIPSMLLRQLYTLGSLVNDEAGFHFSLKNRLRDATLTRVLGLRVNGEEVPLDQIVVELADGDRRPAPQVTPDAPAPFTLRQVATIRAQRPPLPDGTHEIRIAVDTCPFGAIEVRATDEVGLAIPNAPPPPEPDRPAEPVAGIGRTIPYSREPEENDSETLVTARQRFVEDFTGVDLTHVPRHSFAPSAARGNIENFTGVAQVPLGIAGPLLVKGEHASGEFLIPLATSEGTLVASYSRGMRVINLSGGVTCTVQGDCMQRAPVFVFDSAREARDFATWMAEHLPELRREAEVTSHVARLLYVDTILASKFAYTRFNYTTGDAAGQNMVSKATAAACDWILRQVPTVRRFFLESNFATDKKHSQVNVLRGRGKRVTAEVTIPRHILETRLRVRPEALLYHWGVASVGAFLSGANNTGLHSANGLTAMFIATGQDVANVAEGSAAVVYPEMTAAGDLYMSITIPSLIIATHGGGTGLPTQRECLELLGCHGRGKVNKLAEIMAGVVLAGEISLASAISSMEWVEAHERLGRHR